MIELISLFWRLIDSLFGVKLLRFNIFGWIYSSLSSYTKNNKLVKSSTYTSTQKIDLTTQKSPSISAKQ